MDTPTIHGTPGLPLTAPAGPRWAHLEAEQQCVQPEGPVLCVGCMRAVGLAQSWELLTWTCPSITGAASGSPTSTSLQPSRSFSLQTLSELMHCSCEATCAGLAWAAGRAGPPQAALSVTREVALCTWS